MVQAGVREVIWINNKVDPRCSRCGKELGRGNWVQLNQRDGVRCADCAGYCDLWFLGAGDAGLTRMATSFSSRVVIVVKWSSARKRNERQGILIDQDAWNAVADEVERRNAAFAAKKGPKPKARVVVEDGEREIWWQ